MLTVIKLIVVAALVTFLVIRFRSRTDSASSGETAGAASSSASSLKLGGRSARRGKTEGTPARTPRVRPRLAVSLPEGIEDEMDPTPEPVVGEYADDETMVDEPVAEVAVEHPTQVMDALVTASGWPDKGELEGPYYAVDEFTANATDDADRDAALHGAERSEWGTPTGHLAAPEHPTELDAQANLTAAAGWASVDANEVGLDDAISDAPQAEPAPAAIEEWQNDEDFDPATGWSGGDAGSSWGSATEAEAEADAPTWSSEDGSAESTEDEAWSEPAAADHSWQTTDEADADAMTVEEPTPSWDVSDWAAPAEAADTAVEESAHDWVPPTPAPLDEIGAVDHSEDPAWDVPSPEPVAETAAQAVEPAPAFDPMPTAEIHMPPLAADVPEVHFSSAPGEVEWQTSENEVLPLGQGEPVDETESRTQIPVSADPTAPVIMYLQAGDEEMKVVIERDNAGMPIAWVLSGSAKVDAEGSAVRVRIPSPEEIAESKNGAHSDQLGLPAGEEVVEDEAMVEEEPVEAPAPKRRTTTRAKSTTSRSTSTRSRSTASRAKATDDADAPAKPTRTRAKATTGEAKTTTRASSSRSTTSRASTAKKTTAAKTTAKATPAKTTAKAKTTKAKAAKGDLGPLNIAELVQAEANRRIAEVLAEHGSVKTNGDFTGLVDRLEHVSDVPAKGRRTTKA